MSLPGRVLHAWRIPLLVIASIVGMTGVFAVLNRPESYPPAPPGWQTIRPPDVVVALAEQDDVIWAGGPNGLTALDRQSGRPEANGSDFLDKVRYVRDLCVDAEGSLWIAHLAGITRLHDGEAMTFTVDEGLPAGYGGVVIEDHNGVIWAGTETGVATYDGTQWDVVGAEDWPGAIPVTMIFEDGQGVLWFGSDSANEVGLTVYDGVSWGTFSVSDGLVHNTVTDILETHDGTLWVAAGLGDRGGVTRMVGDDIASLTREDGLAGDRARALFEDSLGRVWITSEWDGVAVYENGKPRTITPRDGLAGWEIMEIVEDRDGVLWLGSDNGITRIESVEAVFPGREATH